MRRTQLITVLVSAGLWGCGGSGGGGPDAALGVDDAGHVIDAAPVTSPDGGGVVGDYFWPQAKIDVSGASFLDPMSQTIINNWKAKGGWGRGSIHIDTSINVLHATASTPFMPFTKLADTFYETECDHFPMPLPVGGNVEGSSNYNCPRDSSGDRQDCHLIVWTATKLYEMYQADMTGGTFQGGCQAVWDLTHVYPLSGRGDTCTSVDAAGFPIAALLFNADEVAAGHIDHAIRFILPNDRITSTTYRHPGTHSAGDNDTTGMPYATRLRLKSDAATNAIIATLPTAGAKVLAHALQKYGMFLSDGGNDALTSQDDSTTTAKWGADDDPARLLGTTDLAKLTPDTFEVVKAPDGKLVTGGECHRTCWATADCPTEMPALTCVGAAGMTPGTCQ